MRVVMAAMSDIVRDARVLREARTLAGAGHEVVIYGLRPVDADDLTLPDDLDVRWIGGASPFPRGRSPRRLRAPFRAVRWLLLPAHVRALERSFHQAVLAATRGQPIDVVHAHDFDTLPLGVELADRAAARLVYDSHEGWSVRPRPGRPTPLAVRSDRRLERELGRRADAVITVSPTLGRWLEATMGWDHVSIVRNSFPPLNEEARPPDAPTGLVYAGWIGQRRDLETAIAASGQLHDLEVVLIGPTDPTFLRGDVGVRTLPPVAVDEVDDLLRRWGLALVAMSADTLNHRMALPNRLFQAVRAGVPVVATDLPEVRRVVTEYGIGTLYTPGDVTSLVQAVRRVQERYGGYCASVREARHQLSWNVDGSVLVGLYGQLLDTHRP